MRAHTHERLLALDGLRGLAALAVFVFHLRLHPYRVVPSASLAVDFFFLLSGFVLANAYGERLKASGAIRGFARDRVIRLHPLLILSLAIAALVIALVGASRRDHWPPLTLAVMAIPFPPIWIRGVWHMSFLYNNPIWSLFWELAANLAFALIAPWLRTWTLVVITGLLIFCACALSLSAGGLSMIDVGAALRAFPAFALGVSLQRLYRAGSVKLPRWTAMLAAPLLLASFVPPDYAPVASIAQPLTIYLLYPFIILAAAQHETRFPRLCAFGGGLSYPLYILHVPVLGLLAAIAVPTIVAPFAGVLIIVLAWLLYDEPVRAWLRRRFGSTARHIADAPCVR